MNNLGAMELDVFPPKSLKTIKGTDAILWKYDINEERDARMSDVSHG